MICCECGDLVFPSISGDVQHHFSKMVTLAPAHGNGVALRLGWLGVFVLVGWFSLRYFLCWSLSPAVGNGFIPAYQVAPELDSSGYEVLNDGRVKATFAGRENVYDTVEL